MTGWNKGKQWIGVVKYYNTHRVDERRLHEEDRGGSYRTNPICIEVFPENPNNASLHILR